MLPPPPPPQQQQQQQQYSINWPQFLGTLFLGAVLGYVLHSLTRTKYRQRLRDVPGGAVGLRKRFLDALGRPLQDFSPVDAIHLHLCGIDFPCGLPNNQLAVHHFCKRLNADVYQCVIYEDADADARLIGVEYIISRRLFEQLPEHEKKYWHSHVHDVRSGSLVAPGLPETAEHELMTELLDTYGKAIHLWQVDRGDELPLGPPQLMMVPVPGLELDPHQVMKRDMKLHVNTAAVSERRKRQLPNPPIVDGADPWVAGQLPQFVTDVRDISLTQSG